MRYVMMLHSSLIHLLIRKLPAAMVLVLFLVSPSVAATDWGRAVVDTVIRRHPDPTAFGRWGYKFAFQLYGQYLVFKRTGERRYLEYIKEWLDAHIDAEGNIDQPLDMLDRQ